MLNSIITIQRESYSGPGPYRKSEVSRLHTEKVLFHYGGGSIKKNGSTTR